MMATPRELPAPGNGNEGPVNNLPPKQTTRMLKAECKHETDGVACGYTVRLSKKWAVKLGACCPVHGPMKIDGADEAPGED